MNIIIGIDPGSRMTGYGVIQQQADKLTFLDAGTIYTNSDALPERLQQIFFGLTQVVEYHQTLTDKPIFAAVEQVFMAKNPDSALKLGQARGSAIAALVAKGLSVHEYAARQIKQAVCGYGAANKEQVQAMVVKLLNLSTIPQVDASDGLACAICHAYHHNFNTLLTNAGLQLTTNRRSKKQGRWRLSEADLNIN